jgi:hypothetical protein
MMEPQIVYGPVIDASIGPMYYVTLASGHIVTRPTGFGQPSTPADPQLPIEQPKTEPANESEPEVADSSC